MNNNSELYEKNIELLIKKYPSFETDILEKYAPSSEIVFSEASNGHPTAQIDNRWIHSSRQPDKEAEKLVKRSINNNTGLCIVFGFGLGYHIEKLLNEYSEIRILIIEPEPSLFLASCKVKDLSNIINSERVGFMLDTPADTLNIILQNYKTSNFQSLKLRPLYERNEEYYNSVDDVIKAFIRKKETNQNTLNRFGKIWIKNLFRNTEIFKTANDVGAWYVQFSDIPALVVAAGPSLDGILYLLPELHKRMVIICVDTALRAVMSVGVAPDFIVVVDPQYLNTRHLDGLLSSEMLKNKSVLISESSTHPAIFRNCKIPVYFFKSVFPLGKLLESYAGIHSEIGAGGSVATTAWDLARRLGCGEIYSAGMDLGYPGENMHCRNSLSYLKTILASKRTSPIEFINFSGIRNASPYYEENNYGEKTLTDNRLIIYKWWFETQINNSSDIKLFNLSKFGIKLNGMKYAEAETLLEKNEKRELIKTLKDRIKNTSKENTNFNKIETTITNIFNECERLSGLCSSALGILSNIKNTSVQAEFENGIAYLSKIDKQISESPSKQLTGFIMQPILNNIIDNGTD
ncbi:MAG: DUF115 domain-containing protein, partial [Spirochaetales bacterium]|nr:DUF115 domain-containing protein [Spirochaetales bacterium]